MMKSIVKSGMVRQALVIVVVVVFEMRRRLQRELACLLSFLFGVLVLVYKINFSKINREK